MIDEILFQFFFMNLGNILYVMCNKQNKGVYYINEIQFQLQEFMALNSYLERVHNFRQRIEESFCLQKDPENIISQRKLALDWLIEEILKGKEKKEELSSATGINGLLKFAGLHNGKLKQLQASEILLMQLKERVKSNFIDIDQSEIEKVAPPQEIKRCLYNINKKKIPQYFGIAICPLFENCFIKNKEGYEKCIKNNQVNNLHCTNLGSDSSFVIKSQRYSLQQLFDNLFHQTSEISTVLKIEIDKGHSDKRIEIFCRIQDVGDRPKLYKPLNALKTDQSTFHLYLQEGKDKFLVDQQSFLRCFLTQLVIVPIQTVISDYVLVETSKEKKMAVRKMQVSDTEKDFCLMMKEHPSLRNPLVYFYSFIKYFSFEIRQIVEVLSPKRLIGRFYEILNILSRFIKNDFTLKHKELKNYSLCIDENVLNIIWTIFQEIIILSGWVQEVIGPIKQTVTLSQIRGKLYPIFNQISKTADITYQQYRTIMLSISLESSLSVNVSKVNLERYKDRYISLNSIKFSPIKDNSDIYKFHFAKTMHCYDLRNASCYQSLYFLNFISKNHWAIYKNHAPVHSSWKQKKIWKEIVQIRNKQFDTLPYVGVSLDLLAFHVGFDSIEFNLDPFQSVKNDFDQEELMEVTTFMIRALENYFIKKKEQYLSYLIEKCFKYKKYRVVKLLMQSGTLIKNYEEIFLHKARGFTSTSMLERMEEKNKLIKEMKAKYPQMYRQYQWEQLINLTLKEERGNKKVLQTLGKGHFYVRKEVYAYLAQSKILGNSLSRRDYMYCNNRSIAKIEFENIQAYVQFTEYPLLKYFYHFFLKKIGKQSLSLNFCSFFSQQGSLFNLIQSIPQCFTFQKGLEIHSEKELKNFIKQDEISQAIIISIILMPTNVLLKNIIISLISSRSKEQQDRKSLFIVDFYDYYQKNGFELNGGHAVLQVKNSLFLFQEMGNTISAKLMKKYASMNVLEIVGSVFKKSSAFIIQTNKMRPKSIQQQRQLFSIIFQKGYAFRMAERLFKIKCIFQKKIKQNLPIDHFELLQALDPQMRYYYQELIGNEHNLIERQKMMIQDNYGKPLLITNKFISFIAAGVQMEKEFDSFPGHYMKFSFEGPSQNLRHLNQRQVQLSIYYQKIKDLHDYSHSTIEYFVRNVDLQKYEKEEREQLFNKMQHYSLQYLNREKRCLPLSVIRVAHIEGLKEKHLKFGNERLKDIIFQELSCSQSDLNGLIKKYQNGVNLVVKRVRGIERVGQALMGLGGMLQIKNIKRISITECPNLLTIDLKCDQLQNAILRRNSNLTHIYINSRKLMNLDCSQCSRLRLQNIGIYIFMKCNVLLCNNSCDGDVKRLQDKNYSIFLTRILRYLFNRFHSENLKKLQLALTLNKLELIDEKYYMFGSTRFNPSGLANNLSFITKAGTQALKITQEQIIELFMKNEYIQVLSIDQIMKIQLECLRVAVSYLKKKKITRPLKQLIFRQIIKTPEIEKELLEIVYSVFELIEVSAVFTLRLSLVPEIQIQNYINLIRIINEKKTLEKLQIIVQNSQIDNEFIEYVFNLCSRNKICKLEFDDCSFVINEKVFMENQPNLKQIELKRCKMSNVKFIQKFNELCKIQFNSCRIENIVKPIYGTLGTLRKLKVLELLNLKENMFQNKLDLQALFTQLSRLTALEELNFSRNRMNKAQLSIFSSKMRKIKLYQLILQDFYQPSNSGYIQDFLKNQHIKIIHIEFTIKQNTSLLQSFFDQLAHNESVIQLKLKTDRQVKSTFFEKLKNNNKLQSIHSNQLIPTWLKNFIALNAERNSNMFEPEPFQLLSSVNYKKEDFYRVGLSLDGGGVRGLLLATELDYLSQKIGKPLHKIFDCIGGTSIGGILALASTGTLDGINPVCNTRDLMDIFELYGNKIFKKSQMQKIVNFVDTKYDAVSFEELLYSKFKDTKLSQTLKGTQVVVTAVNRKTNEEVIFRSINSIFDRNKDFYMKDIARATSAAPTYFPSAQIKNLNATEEFSLIDGGVGLNNPSKLVIDDIVKIAQNQSNKNNYFLLSLGTGKMKNEAIPSKAGLFNLQPIIDGFTVAANCFIQKDMAENYRGHYLRVSPSVNLARKDGELDNTRPEVLKVYKEAGLEEAQEQFSNKIAYGKFRDRSFVEWLQQNTARKYDI